MEGESCDRERWKQMSNMTMEDLWEFLEKEEDQETMNKIPTFLLLCFLMIVGIPGNILVLTVYGFRFPSSTTKVFIMAMAAYDLLNCLVGMPFEMVDLRFDIQLDIPFPCKLFRFLVALCSCGSVSVLIVVAADRFRRICRPFRKQMTFSQSKIITGGWLILSLAFSSPALILYGRQTDIRFNHTVYDCSIDDTYRKSSFAYGYQYLLGATWVVCIVTLVVTYGFIIYSIHRQRERRRNLSSSCGSSSGRALQCVQISITDTSLSETLRAAPPSQTEVIAACGSGVVTRTKNGGTSIYCVKDLADDSDAGNAGSSSRLIKDTEEISDKRSSEANRSLKRLFSRDVNPVLQEDHNDVDCDDIMTSYDDEDIISWQDNVRIPPGSSCTKKESLNNFLDFSRDTDLILGPENVEINELALSTSDLGAGHLRARKHGHCLGSYRPFEPMQANCPKTQATSQMDRDWTSNSLPLLDTANTIVRFSSSVRRTSSMPCLLGDINNTSAPTHSVSGNPEHTFSSNKDNLNIPEKTLMYNENQINRENLGDFSSDSLESLRFLPNARDSDVTRRRHKVSNVTWDSVQLNSTTADSLKCSQLSINKMANGQRSGSVVTSKSRKKSQGREIKTSRVSIMMLLVTLGFVLSYLPHLFLQIYSALYGEQVSRWLCPRSTVFIFYHMFFRSFFINNAINPIIYSFYNKTFRNRCLKFIKSPTSLFRGSTVGDHVTSASQENDTS